MRDTTERMKHEGRTWIGGSLLLYLAASLLHFAHNAEYLADYPNLPAWLGRADVYLVWLGLAAVGVGGYALYRGGWRHCCSAHTPSPGSTVSSTTRARHLRRTRPR
ncbi:MAG TPA: hypothetical protein VGL98_04645 [Gammaproteobacteria bacterium]